MIIFVINISSRNLQQKKYYLQQKDFTALVIAIQIFKTEEGDRKYDIGGINERGFKKYLYIISL